MIQQSPSSIFGAVGSLVDPGANVKGDDPIINDEKAQVCVVRIDIEEGMTPDVNTASRHTEVPGFRAPI